MPEAVPAGAPDAHAAAAAVPPGGAPVTGALTRPPPPVPWWRPHADRLLARVPRSRPGVAAAVAGVVVVAVVVAASVRPAGGPGGRPEDSLPRATPGPAATGSGTGGSSTAAGPADDQLVVHVAGAVNDPGVHSVRAGARVVDAITAAGGATPDAEVDLLDLAAKVSDGQRIYVPRQGEDPAAVAGMGSGGPDGVASGPVDLNSATAEQLDTLPGVGPSLAAAIIEYRQRHGPFRSVDQLLDVPGIGDAKLASLRPRVTA